ncbi:NF038105 family protein [Acinetobacter sp. B5B]|uniref:NF038105 family protein n=1 Tax=Acinetobacter baretiae TaxID=2605383 RepID=UPI0018C20A7E|nr:NF038105 family protein [Acinetobacter baretiae]MBF7682075.1 NF038105 family protein [Acinetobacter baretiae]MBF7684685.1 NF038105 family protein [Acinetobacter baretiae]
MTTKNFDEMPTATESLDISEISEESSRQAWADYEINNPQYKQYNKHDLIEALQSCEKMTLLK